MTGRILAMPANAFAGDAAKCLEAGMNGHAAKPINPVILARELAARLGAGAR